MAVSLLSTKLYAPRPQAGVVARPRLIEKLREGTERPGCLTLLSSPAGSGKTTLLSQFVAGLQQPVAWLSLDDGDDDLRRFWRYVLVACQPVLEGTGEAALSLLDTPQPLPAAAIPTLLINDLAAQAKLMVLVLDDYHLIQDAAIHDSMAFLLDHLPDNLRLVVATRVDPPWPLARYRARNRLVEIRAQDLRFNLDEAADFFNDAASLTLSPEEMAALQARTEGWAAGLQLAALSLRGRHDKSSFIQSFSGSHLYVADYLVEEVLQQQPAGVQAFLLQTAILERLSAGLCEAVTGQPGAQAMLGVLRQANLFVLPLDDEGNWFRYHQLFRDLLQARLPQAMDAGDIAGLHARAAAWHEEHGDAAGAIGHALAAEDFAAGARLVAKSAQQALSRGELTTVLRWTEALPAEVVYLNPLVVIARAWALALTGAVPQAEALLQETEGRVEPGDSLPDARELQGHAAALRAFFAVMAGAYPRAQELAERAQALLPQQSGPARWLLPFTLGSAYRAQGQYEKAVQLFAEQAETSELTTDPIGWATGMAEVAMVRAQQGRLYEAAATVRDALQQLAGRGMAGHASLAKLEVPLVDVLREQNELDEAGQRIAGVIRRLEGWPMPTDRLFAYLALLHVQAAQGDREGAAATLAQAKTLVTTQPVLSSLARALPLAEIRLALASGDLAEAARLLDRLKPGTGPTTSLREQELLLLARLQLAQGSVEEAARVLASLVGEARAGEHMSTLIAALALQACTLAANGDQEAALRLLREALALGEPEGFVRVFVDDGEIMRQLLAALARRLPASGSPANLQTYVTHLLAAFGEPEPPAAAPRFAEDEAGLVAPLTARELEVLQLIAAGDSNRAIAEKLVISVSAVKKHSSNIYGKLNVNSRTQAVARARQLNLLPADC